VSQGSQPRSSRGNPRAPPSSPAPPGSRPVGEPDRDWRAKPQRGREPRAWIGGQSVARRRRSVITLA
jgi:hypothetical protein